MRRIISIFISISMILGILPAIVSAETVLAETSLPKYSSNAAFSTETADGQWENGIWKARCYVQAWWNYSDLTDVIDGKYYLNWLEDGRAKIDGSTFETDTQTVDATTRTFVTPNTGLIEICTARIKNTGENAVNVRISRQNKYGEELTHIWRADNILGNQTISQEKMSLYVHKGDLINFEVGSAVEGSSSTVIWVNEIEYTYISEDLDSNVDYYKSDINFSTETADGKWNNGTWQAKCYVQDNWSYWNLTDVSGGKYNLGWFEGGSTKIDGSNFETDTTTVNAAARAFSAPKDGVIEICAADIKNTGNTAANVRIRHTDENGQGLKEIWEGIRIDAGQTVKQEKIEIEVKKGDLVYFEVASAKKGSSTSVEWINSIIYIYNYYNSDINFSTETADGKWNNGTWQAKCYVQDWWNYSDLTDVSGGKYNLGWFEGGSTKIDGSTFETDTTTVNAAARAFFAPKEGVIEICAADIKNTGNAAANVRIRHTDENGQGIKEIWEGIRIDAGQTVKQEKIKIGVKKGDLVYFEVASADEGASTSVEWINSIEYIYDYYKSDISFSTETVDGKWNNGIWQAKCYVQDWWNYSDLTDVSDGKYYLNWLEDGKAKIDGSTFETDTTTVNTAARAFCVPQTGIYEICAAGINNMGSIAVNVRIRRSMRKGQGLETVWENRKIEAYQAILQEKIQFSAKKGEIIYFEVGSAVEGYSSKVEWTNEIYLTEHVTNFVSAQRRVYQSSANFNTESNDGRWDDGIWSAQILNPETDEYFDMEQCENAYGMSEDGQNAATVYKSDSNHMVSAYRMTPPNYENPNENAFWYVSRTFTAPRDGRISITCGENKIQAGDGSKPYVRIRKRSADGAVDSILMETSLVWGGYNGAHLPKHMDIKEGDEIHFEVARTEKNGSTWINLYWDPIITYIEDDNGLFIPDDDGRMIYSSADRFSTDSGDGKWDKGIWSAQILNPLTDEYVNINGINSNKFIDCEESEAYTYVAENDMAVGAYRITPPNDSVQFESETGAWYTSRTFTAPKAGEVTLTCDENKITSDDDSAPKFRIRKVGRGGEITVLLDETVISNSTDNYAYSALTTNVLPGDRIHFEVARTQESGICSPNIYWNPIVTYADSSGSVKPISAEQYPTDIPIYFNGIQSGLMHKPYKNNGVWMVPLKECMAIFGVDISYESSSNEYKGKVGEIELSVTPGTDKYKYDLVDIMLEQDSADVSDDVMVPIDFISKIYGASVTTNETSIRINLQIQYSNDITPQYVDECLKEITTTDMLDTNGIYDIWVDGQRMIKEDKALSNDKFSRALQLTSTVRTNMPWDCQCGLPINKTIAQNDMLVVSFWARSISSDYFSGKGAFDYSHGGICSTHIEVGHEWQRFVLVYKNKNGDIASGASSINFSMGYAPQTVQIAEFKLVNCGAQLDETKLKCDSSGYISENGSVYRTKSTDYHGREDNALWRDEALKRIEKNRVRDINVRVVDENGNPINNAKVSANMTRSEFDWGGCTNYNSMYSDAGHEQYPEKIKQHFNTMNANDYYYHSYDRDKMAMGVKYAYENNMRLRSHCFMWDSPGHLKPENRPDEWITEDTSEEKMIELYTKHASRVLYNFGENIDDIDVLNEPLCNHYFQDKYGRGFVAEMFKRFRLMAPNSRLYINEGWIEGFEDRWHHTYIFKDEILKEYEELGVDFDAIGFQGHYT
ncbi:MAG: endo-1,4-beta-xylanase, partial [Clostridiales bacterium]|nr:endo-1,4-beta-xylanase [Clostridiales bacterium]